MMENWRIGSEGLRTPRALQPMIDRDVVSIIQEALKTLMHLTPVDPQG
jgi:hypothetical protein